MGQKNTQKVAKKSKNRKNNKNSLKFTVFWTICQILSEIQNFEIFCGDFGRVSPPPIPMDLTTKAHNIIQIEKPLQLRDKHVAK